MLGHLKLRNSARRLLSILFILLLTSGPLLGQKLQPLGGTLVVAVPVKEGLVVCSDKRLFNNDARTFNDTFVKIRKINSSSLFVATHTVGFFDSRSGTMEFDAFEITTRYVEKHDLGAGKPFWDGLKKEIADQLRAYLANRKYAEWPESDKKNSNLLFNLLFYSIKENRSLGHSVKVFYEKARTPVIYVSDPVTEEIKSPKLGGKGKELLDYLARNPSIAQEPLITRFGQVNFNVQETAATDAVSFARKLFALTSTALPEARVSSTFDCALLGYQGGFQWLPTGSQ